MDKQHRIHLSFSLPLNWKIALAISVLTTILIPTLTYVLAASIATIHTNGSVIQTIGVEVDPSTITWGTIQPGQQVNATVNVRSSGTQILTWLTMASINWQPSTASSYLTLSWNYTGQTITNQWTPIKFTLTVSPSIQGITDFSFDITIQP